MKPYRCQGYLYRSQFKVSLMLKDKRSNLSFFRGGYKFLLTVMGLKGATTPYACLWCKIHKDRRWETDKHFAHFNTPPMMRTVMGIKQLVKERKGDYCSVKEPL